MSKGRRAVTIISLIIFICALAFVLYKLFQVREITVIGCDTFSEEYVISLSGLEYEQSIFDINSQQILDAIDNEPFLKPIAVEIRYPDCVDIIIEERIKAACIEKEGVLLVIDHEGYLLEVVMQTGEIKYPLVYGLHFTEFRVGERLEDPGAFKLDVISSVIYEAKRNGITLKKIDVEFAADIILEVEKGFEIELGDDTNLAAKFSLIISSMQELVKMGKNSGILDVSVISNAYYREN